ncbi:MAG: glycosyltransferase family 4 protein [Actinomycetia bacterium]|nr:glycosyltransferase family 4 protein [Actinomycetes bacterium]
MKVLMINTEFNRGGAAQIARTLFQSLNQKSEFECYFAYGRGEKADDERAIKFAYLPEVYFQGLLTRCFGLQGYGSWFSTRALEKFIIREKFDLIHLHNLHGYYLNLNFIKFLGRLDIPVVWTLHDGWPITGRCAYWFDCEQWKTGCGKCLDLKRYPKTHLDSSNFMWKKKKNYFTSGWNPIIVSPSKWLADRVKESYLNKYQVKVIPNAIDIEIFKPKDKDFICKKYDIPLEKKIILFVAANLNDERKGVRYFFESLKNIKDNNYLVLTIGKKINLTEEIKIEVDVRQLGYVFDKETMSDIYSMADIFCITSLDDNFPTTVLESMACGVPVVGFSVGGIPEQVKEDCGILVDPKDTEALSRALEKLLNDDKLRKKFSENCRKRILKNYTIKKFTDNYIKVYKALRRLNQ